MSANMQMSDTSSFLVYFSLILRCICILNSVIASLETKKMNLTGANATTQTFVVRSSYNHLLSQIIDK